VLDTPPFLPVTDAAVAAAEADGVILVVRSGETEEPAAVKAVDQLRRIRIRIAGAVLNGVTARRDRHYSYYGYGTYTKEKRRGERRPSLVT
jgi:Mrp family chromosome partitioning ATPase